MISVVVTGIGLSCALGHTLVHSWEQLLAQRSGIQTHQPFPEIPPWPLGLVGPTPSSVVSLLEPVVQAVLGDAQLTAPLPTCGVVIGSSRGYEAEWETQLSPPGPNGGGSPHGINFLDLYGQSPASQVAQRLRVRGPVLAPRAACATGLWAIAQGAELIRTGACDQVIAGAVEAPITPLTWAGFAQMGALATTGAYPFDRRRQGLVLGEGAVLLVLESGSHAAQRSVQPYGQILGFGCTADGYHRSAPDLDRRWAIVAIQQSLQRSGRLATHIDYIHAHGTATPLNDSAEATLIGSLFPQRPAVSSTKGATGHTLGASGAMGVAWCLLALQHQIIPPCVGLQDPEFDLNFATVPQPTRLRHALCLSFGFGGQNTALVIAAA